jgi:dipeptidyl-peptidase-4
LWNDEGHPFRDVWVVSASGEAQPRRLTDMARDFPSPSVPDPPAEDSFVALRKKAMARGAPGVSEIIWTPDGKALFFGFRGDLFRLNPDGSGLKRLTRSGEGKRALAFSPDGQYLSFLQGGDLWLWNQQTNHLVQATDVGVAAIGRVPGSSFDGLDREIMSYKWSPDSRQVALYQEDRRHVRKMLFPNYLGEETAAIALRRDLPGDNDQIRTIGLFSLASGRVRTIELGDPTDRRIGSYEWSPEGSRLLVDQSSEDAEHRWIHVVDAADSADISMKELWHSQHPKRGSTTSASALWTAVWQRDGQGILFISDIEDRFQLYSLPLSGGKPKPLTPGDWSIVGSAFEGASLNLSPRTNEVFFVSTKASPYERQVYRMPESGGEVVRVTSLAGTHQHFLAPDGSRVAVLHSSDVSPTELYIVENKDGATERRITHSPPDEFDQYPWIQPRYVTFKSRADEATLHGRLMEPPNLDRSKKYPAILGPVYSNTVRNRWAGVRGGTLQQYLSLEGGYIGLQVDIRGSVGYGRSFREGAVLNIGEIDIEDLHSGVEYLESLSYVDPERIGIWGWSYGGLLAAMSVFKKPGVYQVGVAGAPATNVWHATTGEVDLFYRPVAQPEAYRKGSAVRFAEGLRDPLMLIHGMQDSIVLFKDSVVLVEKLMLAGKDFEFVMLPSSVHDAWRQDYVATHVMKKIVGFFDRHLGRGAR